MNKVTLFTVMISCIFFAKSQNVGIGIITPTKGRLEVFGALTGGTVASFGTDGTGISLQRNWPTIGFNQYRDNAGIARYMGTGMASWLYYEPSGGTFGWDVYNTAGTADQLIVGTGTRALSILNNGNIGIKNGGQTDASLVVSRGSNLSGAAIFQGTTHNSYFAWNTQEDTYIRGGKDASKVIINDIANSSILAHGKMAIGNYPDNSYQPKVAAEIWGAVALTNVQRITAPTNITTSIFGPQSSYYVVTPSSGNLGIILSSSALTVDGQMIVIECEGANATTVLGGTGYQVYRSQTIGGGDVVTLIWNAVRGKWMQLSYSDN
jgi:hypothetical protein